MKSVFKKEMIIFVGIVLGTLLIAGGALLWLNDSIVQQAQQIAQNRLAFMQYSNTINLLADLKRVAPLVKGYQDKMDLLLPKKDDLLEFPRWIDGISRVNTVNANVAFQGTTVAAGDQQAGSIGFTLDVSGSDQNIRGFFRALELTSNRFLTSIDNFDYTEDSGTVRVIARGRVFFK